MAQTLGVRLGGVGKGGCPSFGIKELINDSWTDQRQRPAKAVRFPRVLDRWLLLGARCFLTSSGRAWFPLYNQKALSVTVAVSLASIIY